MKYIKLFILEEFQFQSRVVNLAFRAQHFSILLLFVSVSIFFLFHIILNFRVSKVSTGTSLYSVGCNGISMINVMETLEYPGAFQPRSGTARVGHHLNTTKF